MLSSSSWHVIPLVARSAGFSSPGTCLHCSTLVVDRISLTLFATQTFLSSTPVRIHCSATDESVQKNISVVGWSCRMESPSLLAKTELVSSNLGRLVVLPPSPESSAGATRDLLLMRLVSTLPSPYSTLE